MRIAAPLMPVATLLLALSSLLSLPSCALPEDKDDVAEAEAARAAEAAQAAAKDPSQPPELLPIVAADMSGLPNSFVVGDFIVSGKPSPEGLGNARDAGVTLVINAQTQPELTFDERSFAQGLGMRYVSVGFTPETLDDVVVESFIFEVKRHKPEDGKVLLHCSSGNRVAALWAMYEIKELKLDPEKAVERARKLGLKSPDLIGYIGDYSRRIGAL